MRIRFFILFVLFLSPFMSGFTQTNIKPEFEDEIDLKKINASQNIMFDNYEEVFIKNFEKEEVTEIHFLGNVKIRFQGNVLMARKVIVTAKGDQVLEISAYQNVEFRYGSDIYLAKSLIFEPEKKRGVLKNVRSYMTGGMGGNANTGWYYTAQSATILDQNRVVLEKVVFTTSDELSPHYSFYAGKLWFFKHQVVYALNITYTVGQADFLYFPFFMQWEKGTGIKTAFGQEKRIGWYMMNSYSFNAPYGRYDVGLDLYERLGEYAFMKFNTSKSISSNISRINAEVEVADDVRLFTDTVPDPVTGTRYTQLQDVYGDGQYTSIRQLSWRYKVYMDFKVSDMSANVTWEDKNDANFSSKYSTRYQTFDVQKLLQAEDNSFYSRSDASVLSVGDTIAKGFNVSAGDFKVSGSWVYQRQVANETNQYLNDRYDYLLYSRALPKLSYRPKDAKLLDNVQAKIPQNFSVNISNTNLIFDNSKELQVFIDDYNTVNGIKSLEPALSMSNQQLELISSNLNTLTNGKSTNQTALSNRAPAMPSLKITTNYYVIYNVNSALHTDLSFNASEILSTNGDVTSDRFDHTENGSVSLNGAFVNGLVSLNNSLSFNNYKTWTSFETNNSGDAILSGVDLNLSSRLSMSKTFNAWNLQEHQLNIPLSLSHTITYPLYTTKYKDKAREIRHDTSFSTGFNMFKNQLNLSLSVAHSMNFRITNGVVDEYINNKIFQQISVTPRLTAWWFAASTSTWSVNLLETYSNALTLDHTDLTNRIYGTPDLILSFTVPKSYLTATYVYDLIDATNVSLGLRSTVAFQNLKVPLIYELTSLNFSGDLSYNFLQTSSSLFTLTYSMSMRITKYWKLNFNTSVRNTQIYRYFAKDVTSLPNGVTPLNFWEDLGDSLKIWDYEALKRGNFKIQDLRFNLEHDLDEWMLSIQFNITRKRDYINLFAYWEPSIRVEFKMKESQGSATEFPPFDYKFVPEEYQ